MNDASHAFLPTRTTCPYCGVGCGVLAAPQPDGSVQISGDPNHPSNSGRLCSKGAALGETLNLDGRLLYPEIDGQRSSWEQALDLVAAEFTRAITCYGPDSVAFYVSGQLLTEDYYVANKLMKGYIGSANIDTNSRLCMASSVAGHRRAFGTDTVPGLYEDLELADLVILVGSNLAWCHPVLYQRLAAAKQQRPEMIVVLIDPRRTMTADIADMHLPIAPDGDVALFNGLLAYLAHTGRLDKDYIDQHTTGFDTTLASISALSIPEIMALTDLSHDEIEKFYKLYASTDKVVTVYSQGVNQSSCGTDKVNTIINCHLATGRIGKPGTGPFSITGQPNAMGGREVGGLANMLAAHMDIENSQHRDSLQRFWNSPSIAEKPGLKAIDLFEAVDDGRIKALWIMATNPADSMPDADFVQQAIQKCPFVVISDVQAETDTARHAHVKLPSTAWGEKDGTVTNSERRISRQRAFLPSPGEARPDWWQMAELARRMAFGQAFAYDGPADIFREYATLTAWENDGTRDLDLGAFTAIEEYNYDTLTPFIWPRPRNSVTDTPRFFADGGFFTVDRKARFIAANSAPEKRTSKDYPLILNTGRVRDHWHTMTRTGKSPRLSAHIAEPFIEIHPCDAKAHGINEADIVRMRSQHGEVLMRALLTKRQQRGYVFSPMHWTDQFASKARIDTLISSLADPYSGQPALKHSAVQIERYNTAFHGFAISAEKPALPDKGYWALAATPGGWRMELAGEEMPLELELFARSILNLSGKENVEPLAYHDAKHGNSRTAFFSGQTLLGAVYLSREPVSVSRSWICEMLAAGQLPPIERHRILASRAAGNKADKGAIICSCFSVGANEIRGAIQDGSTTVTTIGKTLSAGTNCGSCRSEIQKIINQHTQDAAVS